MWATRASVYLVLTIVLVSGACSDGGSGEATSAAGAASETTATAGGQSSTTVPAGDAAPTSTPGESTQGTATTTTPPTATTRPAANDATTTSLGGPGLPPSTPPSQPVVTGGGGSVATGLTAAPGCEAARGVVKLSWQPGGASEQVVAVSTRKDGLDTGNYTTSEVLAPDRATYSLSDSQPGGIYYWRVLTRRDGGWAASATAQFEGPTCVPF